MISLRDVTVRFEGARRPALDGVSIDVERGAWISVVGTNGSGKSTLLAALAGVIPLDRGTRTRDGEPRIALLQQDADNQLVATSVRSDLALSVPVEVARAEAAARIDEATGRFDLGGLLHRNPHRLSGGEKQRVACATVWLERPDVLLLDEPLAFLDSDARARVVEFVREAHASGVTIVWSTPGDDASLARTCVTLDHGRVVPNATTRAEEAPVARARPSRARGATVVRADGVAFSYRDGSVLRAIDLDVMRGECVGIVGRNGSGKSTLLTLLGGALAPSAGRVARSFGEHGALYLPQSPERMFFAETVHEEVAFGLARRLQRTTSVDALVRASLDAVGLDSTEFAPRSPFELSFGEARRVAFAIAHAMTPDLLLLDEPASSLDRAGREVLVRLIDARLDAGAAVIVASHDAGDLDGLVDRSLELDSGRLLAP